MFSTVFEKEFSATNAVKMYEKWKYVVAFGFLFQIDLGKLTNENLSIQIHM